MLIKYSDGVLGEGVEGASQQEAGMWGLRCWGGCFLHSVLEGELLILGQGPGE